MAIGDVVTGIYTSKEIKYNDFRQSDTSGRKVGEGVGIIAVGILWSQAPWLD